MDIKASLVTAAAIAVTVASFAFAVYADEEALHECRQAQPAAGDLDDNAALVRR